MFSCRGHDRGGLRTLEGEMVSRSAPANDEDTRAEAPARAGRRASTLS